MNVELISVGTELLLGDITNTNTVYLSKELANMGINVFKHTTVGDNKERLLKVLNNAFKENDTVIITGGLGPTEDDITKECVADYFKKNFYLDEYSWNKIKKYISKYNKNDVVTDNNKKQALIPEGAIIVENFNGTAPGIILEDKEKRIILLPGPPEEMKNMFIKSIKPYLQKLSNKKIVSKYVRFYGIGESLLEEKIKHILAMQTNPTIALYAKTGEVLIRITASSESTTICNNIIDKKILEIKKEVGEYIYLIEDEITSESELSKVVNKLLIEKNVNLAIAESITGGLITSLLIDNIGASNYLLESIVCYSNESKINSLKVKKETLKKHTAVSREVAYEMVKNIAEKNKTDLAVATTGYADGENSGLVYIGIYNKGEVYVKKYQFNGNRNKVRDKVAKTALNSIRKILLKI